MPSPHPRTETVARSGSRVAGRIATALLVAVPVTVVTAAGAGLCTRTDVVDGAEAKAARRLGAMVIVMVFSLSGVNRTQ